jgi:hypothetical protein
VGVLKCPSSDFFGLLRSEEVSAGLLKNWDAPERLLIISGRRSRFAEGPFRKGCYVIGFSVDVFASALVGYGFLGAVMLVSGFGYYLLNTLGGFAYCKLLSAAPSFGKLGLFSDGLGVLLSSFLVISFMGSPFNKLSSAVLPDCSVTFPNRSSLGSFLGVLGILVWKLKRLKGTDYGAFSFFC